MSVAQNVGMAAIPAAPGMWARVARAVQRTLCAHSLHGDNAVIGVGRVLVTCKRNRPEIEIPGRWLVHLCQRCGEHYSSSGDRLE